MEGKASVQWMLHSRCKKRAVVGNLSSAWEYVVVGHQGSVSMCSEGH